MTDIPADIEAVWSVVTGAERLPLKGELRCLTITAMTALGYSRDHIAWALMARPTYIGQLATDMGIRLHLHEQNYDPLAVEWVCQGTKMPLKGADREEAIRRLGPRYSAPDIARLLGSSPQTVSQLASRLGVQTVDRRHRATA